jgi:hypothetical protein
MTNLKFQIYKIRPKDYTSTSASATSLFTISRFESTAFDSINISLGSPVSPMPLPEDDAESNILVKMEGNTKQVRFSCKFDKNLVNVAKGDYLAKSNFKDVEDNKFDPDTVTSGTYNYTVVPVDHNLKLLNLFTTEFENRSMTDSYLFRIYDDDANESVFTGYGTITSIDTSTDSSSPVVWTLNVDYLIGDVISIYDADTPDQPNNVAISAPSSTSIKFDWTAPTRSGGSSITKYKVNYKKIDQTDFTRVEVLGNTTFTKTITGLSGGYYSCYINAYNTGGAGTKSDNVDVEL